MLIHYYQTIYDYGAKTVAANTEIQVMLAGSNSPATLFSEAGVALGNTVATSELGIADFWIQPGEYRLICGEAEMDNITIADATGPIKTVECPVESGVVTIDLNNGGDFYTIADADITELNIVNRPQNGVLCKFEWRITQDDSGNHTLTPPINTTWLNGVTLDLNLGANSLTTLEISFTNGGDADPAYHFAKRSFTAESIAAPSGGTVIDAESRATITEIISALQKRGIVL